MNKQVGFGTAFALFFKRYVDFTGRSSRAEYWWWQLWKLLIGMATFVIWLALTTVLIGQPGDNTKYNVLAFMVVSVLVVVIYHLAILVPTISLLVRRFRDTGISPLWVLVPYLGPRVVTWLVWLLMTPVTSDNWLDYHFGWQLLIIMSGYAVFGIFQLIVVLLPNSTVQK